MADSDVKRKRPQRKSSKVLTIALASLTGLGVLAFVGAVGGAVWIYNQASGSGGGDVGDGTWLVTRLEGGITDAPVQGGLFDDPGDFPPIVTEYASAIRAAGADDRIEGMVLRIDGPSMGLAGSTEVRDALVAFREAGKPCVAYSEMYTTGSYYLASACDTVLIAPTGIQLVSGMALSVTYYTGLFENLGIQADYEHVGDFKSAVEVFERTEPSEAAAASYEYLLDGIWPQLVHAMADGRGKSDDEMAALIDGMELTPELAIASGMIDGVAYPDAISANILSYGEDGWLDSLAAPTADLTDEEAEDRFTSMSDYLADLRARPEPDDKIAVVYAEGNIVSGDGGGGPFGGSSALADQPFREWMEAAREDDAIKAVVLRVNSPGGSGLASDMMWREVVRTQAAGKPVVVSMANYAASGGYFISAPADWIVAQPTTITGSIGVFGGKFNVGGLYEKVGMTTHTYQRGDRANIFSGTQPFSDGEREAFRTYLGTFYDDFLSRVAQGRDMEIPAVHEVAQGRVWTGTQALDRGLVDELGGLDVALVKAGELASLSEWGVTMLPERKGFLEVVMEDFANAQATASPHVTLDLPVPGAEQAIGEALLLDRILADGAAVWMPGAPTFE